MFLPIEPQRLTPQPNNSMPSLGPAFVGWDAIANGVPPLSVLTFQSALPFASRSTRHVPPPSSLSQNTWQGGHLKLTMASKFGCQSRTPTSHFHHNHPEIAAGSAFKMHFPTQFLLSLFAANIPYALGRPRGCLARAVPARRDAQSNQQIREVTIPPSSTIANTTSSEKRYDTRIWTVVRATKFATSIVTVTITTPPSTSSSAGLTTACAPANIPSESTVSPSRQRHSPRPTDDEIVKLPSDFERGYQLPIQRRTKERRVPRHLNDRRSGIPHLKPPSIKNIPVPLLEEKKLAREKNGGESKRHRPSFSVSLIPNPHFLGRQDSAEVGFQAMVHAFAKHGVPPTQAMEQALALNPNITRRKLSLAKLQAHR